MTIIGFFFIKMQLDEVNNYTNKTVNQNPATFIKKESF